MRKSHILVHNLQGIATEVIKNIVLSGIGRLTLLDPVPVAPEDLASGFFFREDDVGQLRVEVAKDRIQKLNPLVRIDCQSDPYLLTDAQRLKELDVDVIVSTAGSRQEWVRGPFALFSTNLFGHTLASVLRAVQKLTWCLSHVILA